jgi:DNA-directed RNA polymerase beta' subunit
MSLNSKYYTEDINTIQSVDFSILTNKDVKKYSAVRKDPFGINIPESYDNYEPKKGGLVDLRLGTCDPYLNCTTCGLNSNECPGHFGHTELSEPVYHFGFLNNLKTVLQCICFRCTNIIIEKSSKVVEKIMKKKEKFRLKELREISKTNAYCQHCGTPVSTVTKEVKESTASINIFLEREVGSIAIDENTGETTDTKRKIKEPLHPRKCYNILRNISDEDTYLLGFNPKISRPEDFICIRFPIPPVIIRPTAKIDFLASSTMEDSLTLKIADIITWNTRIRNQNEKAMSGVDLTSFNENMQSLLQYHCATYFDNETLNLPKADFKASNKPIKSISERIKGKQGRVRANLMGKRVDFSARSVITSDPYIDIDEVGVPKRVAMDLTIPEEVTPFNIKKLAMLVKKGREIYPGANYVHRVNYIDGKLQPQRIDLKYRKKDIKLTYGDIVDRHIINGDYVLFNRQPTLHKPSMMGHKIQVINADNTDAFRMNVSVTKPYNADFDGDEMNIHLAQSVQARNELERIANVKYNIIGARDSNPIIGCVQDTLTGAYVLSLPNQTIDYHTACNILCGTTSESKYNLTKNKDLTGYELFSEIIPKGINVVSNKLTIKDGQIIKGTLNNASLSSQKNSIIHYIWDKYGADKTRRFIDDSQRLILEYLMYQGVTIGPKDIFIEEDMTKKLFDQANTAVLDAKHYITKMENDNNDISPQVIENAILSKMEPVGANTGSTLMKYLNSDNNFFKMVDSKAKGNPQNIYQTMGVIGQLTLSKARPKKNIQNRTLPYFHADDDTPGARGFVFNNLVKGLTGHEFFFNAGAGREGLIDTAIKSVSWDTPVIIQNNGKTEYKQIGEWIDNTIDIAKRTPQYKYSNEKDKLNLEIVELPDGTYIPTTDYNGNVTWGKVSAVTRHDPGEKLYKIKTDGGRDVVVTAAKSLLIWNKEIKQFREKLTTEIVVGDYVPVTLELADPPAITENINLSDYLSKSEYIYGTDFNIANKLMEEEMENKEKCSNNWWTTTNNNKFELPFKSKSSLLRSITKLNESNNKFESNYIYPYGANQKNTFIKDTFELNKENGIFIGLFLSEGSITGRSTRITNLDENIQQFVKGWFESNNINYDIEDKINKYGGKSFTIRGHSTILTKFITKLVGKGAENKFVPSEAFTASKEFISGLLNGYFSGDGCITKNSIDASSASKRLIEGISMLCSRLGIFCKTYTTILKKNNFGTKNIKPSHRLRISSQWAELFSRQINLIHKEKDSKMKLKKWTKKHQKYESLNNIVMDSITEIIEINKDEIESNPLYNKMYDLTIPSTFNFGLSNGLQVRDTATTGYIQRRLVKALEDLSVKYDGTIRTANSQIIQYIYGENGINQLTQTDIKIDLVKYNDKELEEKLAFNKKQISELETIYKKKVDVSGYNKEYINKMKDYRDKLRFINYKSLSNYKELKEQYMLPVNLYRITQDFTSDSIKQILTKQLYSESKELLTPQYIQSKIDSITESDINKLIIFSRYKNKLMSKDEQDMKLILKIALHEYLSPMRCIYEYGLTYETFNNMIKDIENSYIKSIVEPGEMVGVIAAQSLGEPTTQMSLDTKHSAGKVGVLSTSLVGVPRIQEILSYSKSMKTPQTLIYFDKSVRSDKTSVNKINSYLKHLTIRELIDAAEIYYQVNTNNSLDTKLKNDNVVNPFFIGNQKTELVNLPFIFRLKMNLEKMYDKETSLLDIKTKFMSYWYNNSQNTKTMKKLEKEIFTRINRLAILSSTEDNNELILHIRFSLNSFDYGILSDFLSLVLDKISLKGMDNIVGTNLIEDEKIIEYQDDGSYNMANEHMVVTEGINLNHIKKFKNIDFTRTRCNDVHTTFKNYGIEAARTSILKELINTFGSGGIDNINHNHLSVLVDFMSANGEITSIDRHGLGKLNVDPLAKCSFEKTMDHLVQAAVFNETDHLKSVSSKIMLGQVIPGGTGAFNLILDTEKLVNSEYTSDEANKYGEFRNIEADPLMLDIMKFGINETNFYIPAY